MLSVFPNFNVLYFCIAETVGVRSHIRKHKILAGKPIGSCFLIGCSNVIIVQRANFLSVNEKINHVRTVFRNAVFKPVSMRRRAVDSVILKGNSVVMASAGSFFAHCNKPFCCTLEDIACVIVCVYIIGSKNPCTCGTVFVHKSTFAFPFNGPGFVVHKHNRFFKGICCFAENSVGGGTGKFCKSVFTAFTDEVCSVKFPAVIFRFMD